MEHPQTFLLKKIIGHEKNGLTTLGRLNAEHVKDLVVVMTEFSEALLIEAVEHLVKGETIELSDGRAMKIKRVTNRKSSKTNQP